MKIGTYVRTEDGKTGRVTSLVNTRFGTLAVVDNKRQFAYAPATLDVIDHAVVLREAGEVIDAHEFGASMDAGFDGGEFSGPASDRTLDRALDALAAKHSITRDTLDQMLNEGGSE